MTWNEKKYDEFVKRMEGLYPSMFSEPYGGFAIGEGWWPIVEVLCAQIDHYIKWKNRDTQVVAPVIVHQIKEKFGGLRFYFEGGDEYCRGLAAMAEEWCNTVCETCGERGTKRAGGWMRTLCDKHELEYQDRLKIDREKYGD